MVEAQSRMQTDVLIALMFMSAIVGFLVDRILQVFNKRFTKWRKA
jgi:ABC-type nitrate/sulfonate/bicarbonate transport system permease component